MSPTLTLRTAIGTYDHTRPLKEGAVTSRRIRLDQVEYSPVNRAFRPMANDLAFDVSEMAIVTYMLAKAFDRPLVGLPLVLMRQAALPMLVCLADSDIREPMALSGRTIGVRAYSQTTGVWARGILQDRFGLDLNELRWLTLEAAHVDGYQDPGNVRRADLGRGLPDMLRSGEIDAAVGLDPRGQPGLRAVLPDAEAAEAGWSREMGVEPINHLLVLKADLVKARPWLVRELWRLFEASDQQSQAAGGRPAPRWGLQANRPAIETVSRYAFEQGITPRIYTAEELFPLAAS